MDSSHDLVRFTLSHGFIVVSHASDVCGIHLHPVPQVDESANFL